MEGLYLLNIAAIFVTLHSKGAGSRPKRSLLPENTFETKFAPETFNIIGRPKRGADISSRPKLTYSIKDSITRPKRSVSNQESTLNNVLSDEISRPKRQRLVDNRTTKSHTKNIQVVETDLLSSHLKRNDLVQSKKDMAKAKNNRSSNKLMRLLIERLCRKGETNSDISISLCSKAKRLAKKAWGNPALPPHT